MPSPAADILAAVSIAMLLGGVNDNNPHQMLCLAAAALLALASYGNNP